MKKTVLVSALCVCFFIAKAQDTVWLKSGKTLGGQIVSFTDNSVRLKAGQDTVVYRLGEIKSLRYNGPATKNDAATPVKIYKSGNNIKKEDETEVKPVKKETK